MNDYLKKARRFLEKEQIDYLLVNSTNEFLVEYNDLQRNSRYHLTGFSGSTGDALVSLDNVYLFVDGRYHVQADLEVDHNDITVIKLQMGEKTLDKMFEIMDENSVLGLCSKKNSQFRYKNICAKLNEKNISVKLFDIDPTEKPFERKQQNITEISVELTGKSSEDKVNSIKTHLKNDEAILITNLEEISYLFNIRNFEQENSCSVEGKAIISNNETRLFKDETLNDFENYIKNLKGINTIYTDETSISAHDYALLGEKAKKAETNYIRMTKCIKTDAELEHYKDAFRRTDAALLATRQYILETDNISEFDIKNELERNFRKYGAVSQSFTSIIAKDQNSALAHYSKSSKDEILKDGSLVLIDCGAYYNGGLATDITRVFVKGEPSELHKKIYTMVLKAFLRAYNTEEFDCGFDIDFVARDFLMKNLPDGFVFNHGLGHGIGVSVHEGPPRLSTPCPDAFVELQDNMCFTIEPGLYGEGHFGVRLENSCYYKKGKIQSFTNMCYEKKLIDFSMLTEQEKVWLDEFEVR
ncbi:M24 family metallopeptidase [bacterium]|nr:M24 family metallopeptidase [bacterium]